MPSFFTDTHAHIHMPPLKDDIKGVVERALAAEVKRIITVGIDPEDSILAAKAACSFENVYAAVGVHPQDCGSFTEKAHEELRELARWDKILAIGEIGLDFYWEQTEPKSQETVFRRMLGLSRELKKPVIIHEREASRRSRAILEEELGGGRSCGGILHCFCGDGEMMEWGLNNGFYISFAGNVTYKSAVVIRESLKKAPLDRIFIETDSPYLAPVPLRGKTNEPANLTHTAGFVAGELQVSMEELSETLESNFIALFGVERLNG